MEFSVKLKLSFCKFGFYIYSLILVIHNDIKFLIVFYCYTSTAMIEIKNKIEMHIINVM